MNKSINTKPKRTQRDYTLGFKLSIVEQVEKGEMTYKQAQKTYGIQGRSTVLVWCRKHGKLDWRLPTLQPMMTSKETPIQTIKRLEKELDDERCRTLVLNGMIDIVDQQYGANIRKKHLPKALETYKLKNK